MMAQEFALASTTHLSSGTCSVTFQKVSGTITQWGSRSTGYDMPLLGFGVYQNYTTHDSVLEAFKVGYRY